MTIEQLKSEIPGYAKDIKLNLSNILQTKSLTERQLWGTMLAAAYVSGNRKILNAVENHAASYMTSEEIDAAKSAAAIMGMNNIYYRSLHLISNKEYANLPARLRMNVIANPGVDKLDFEIWSLAASAINGCGMCIDSHEREVLAKGLNKEGVQDVLRIASIIHAVAVVLNNTSS